MKKSKACFAATDAPVRLTAKDLRGGPARLPGEPVITKDTVKTYGKSPPAVLYKSNTFSNH